MISMSSNNADSENQEAIHSPTPLVHIIVLGDITRSPRMQYHAKCFAQSGWRVNISGFSSAPRGEEQTLLLPPLHPFNASIKVLPVWEPPKWIQNIRPAALAWFFKFVLLFLSLFLHLWRHTTGERHLRYYFVQCPPAVPTFLATWLVMCVHNSSIRNSRRWRRMCPSMGSVESAGVEAGIAVDWHNYGFTLLQARKGEDSSSQEQLPLMSRIYRNMEVSFARQFFCEPPPQGTGDAADGDGRQSFLHFTVSKAMQKDLHSRGVGPVTVLYDRPLSTNGPLDAKEVQREELLEMRRRVFKESSLAPYLQEVEPQFLSFDSPSFLLVSSCSWSVDDDFGPLLAALDAYVEARQQGRCSPVGLPPLLCIITGKGPMKAAYERELSQRRGQWAGHACVVTPWLSSEDYPEVLRVSDLGVCLHRSSSGLDLPMKVVDMLAVGLPVLALRYACIHELVLDSWNGRVFRDERDLFAIIVDLVGRHQETCTVKNQSCGCELARFRKNIHTWRRDNNWETAWQVAINAVL